MALQSSDTTARLDYQEIAHNLDLVSTYGHGRPMDMLPLHSRGSRGVRYAKTYQNIQPYLQYFFNEKSMWPCHALLGSPACLRNFIKLVWIIAYSEEKELCKNGQRSSHKKYLRKMGVALTHPSEWITMLEKLKCTFWTIIIYLLIAKIIMEKYSCNNFLNN